MTLSSSLRSVLSRPAARQRRRQVKLHLESLEDRVVPTVLFKPVFGPEAIDSGTVSSALSNPNIYPIFWGSFWQTQSGNAAAQALARDLAAVTESDYLSGTVQYGTDGHATLMGRFGNQIYSGAADLYPPENDLCIDPSQPPAQIPSANPPWGDPVGDEVENVISNPGTTGIPNPSHLNETPIYVVITGPSIMPAGNFAGFNEPADVVSSSYHDVVWVRTKTNGTDPIGLDQDFTTRVFSHEIVEAMTDPLISVAGTQIGPGVPGVNTFPATGTSAGDAEWGQICDNEPNNNYYYRVRYPVGAIVQAFPTQNQETDYIVDDGNSLTMEIDPNPWSGSKLAFHGGTLVINADQYGGIFGTSAVPVNFVGNQTISLSSVQMPGDNPLGAPTGTLGVAVVMDGEKFDFEPGQITGIQVDGGNTVQTINLTVNPLPSGVGVAVAGGNVDWNLKLVDGNSASHSDSITSSSVTVDGRTIPFGPSFTPKSLEVDTQSTLTVQNTPSNTAVTANGDTVFLDACSSAVTASGNTVFLAACSSAVTINGGDVYVGWGGNILKPGSLAPIGGPVFVNGASNLFVDDWGDLTHNPFTITSTEILYGPKNNPLVTITDSPAKRTILAGPGTQNISLDITNQIPTTIEPLGPCTVSLVSGNTSGTSSVNGLTVDASGDSSGNPITVTNEEVQYGPTSNAFDQPVAPFVTINYFTKMNKLTVDGGQHTPTIFVDSVNTNGPTIINPLGTCAVSVSPNSHDLDNFAGLTIHGAGNTSLTLSDQAGGNSSSQSERRYALTSTELDINKPLVPTVKGPFTSIHFSGLGSLSLSLSGQQTTYLDIESVPSKTTIGGGDNGTDLTSTISICAMSANLDAISSPLTILAGTLNIFDQANADAPAPANYRGNSYPNIYSFTGGTFTRTVWVHTGQHAPQKKVFSLVYSAAATNLWAAQVHNVIQIDQLGPKTPNGAGLMGPLTVHAGTAATQITVTEPDISSESLSSDGFAFHEPGTSLIGNLTIDGQGASLTVDASAIQNSYQPGDTPITGTVRNNVPDFTVTDQTVTYQDYYNYTSVDFPNGDQGTDPSEGVPGKTPNGSTTKPSTFNKKLSTEHNQFTSTISYSGLRSLTVDGQPGSTFTIQSTASGTPVTVKGGTGESYQCTTGGANALKYFIKVTPIANLNTFNVGNNGSVKQIQSQLTLIGQGANSNVVVDDSQARTQDQVTISNAPAEDVLLGTAAVDQFFAAGGGLDCLDMDTLTLNLSKAAGDTVQLTPSTVTAVLLNGDPGEQSGNGAVLSLSAGAISPHLTTNGPGAGKWTFGGNEMPVTYTNFNDLAQRTKKVKPVRPRRAVAARQAVPAVRIQPPGTIG
jgi:hypothetical protein